MVGITLWHGVELMALVEVAVLRTALRTAAALTFKRYFIRDRDEVIAAQLCADVVRGLGHVAQ
jgi:hypothetical protein